MSAIYAKFLWKYTDLKSTLNESSTRHHNTVVAYGSDAHCGHTCTSPTLAYYHKVKFSKQKNITTDNVKLGYKAKKSDPQDGRVCVIPERLRSAHLAQLLSEKFL